MFDFVAKYRKWVLIGLLVLIVPPFALFGIDSYFQGDARGQVVAKVGDYEISEQEFQEALRERQDMLRNMSGGKVDPALLESPEQRAAVLDNLVRQRVLLGHALRSGLTITPDQVRAMISQAQIFQEAGQFSLPRYQQFLETRNQTATQFENSVRQDLLLRQLSSAYAETSFVPRTVAERLLKVTEQQREVSRAVVAPGGFTASVKLEDGAVKKYYDEHQDEFRIPDQVRVEYVVLSAEASVAQIQVDPAEVKQFYDQNQRQFGVPESRQASHILITVDKGAPADAKQKARALADEIHTAVSKNPSAFAEMAKKHSQDPGSAAKGGELGSFPRGSMVKAFDDTVFGMKVGEISKPVESDFGYHIIRLTGITPGTIRSLGEARADIENELKKQRAGRLYAELAEKFNNTVFEQSDSLKPAAELVKQAPQESGWITRAGAQDPKLNNPKFIQAVFSEDVLMNKRNSEAVEIAPGTLVSARIIEHKPSSMQAFADVRSAIEKKLTESRASQLAAQAGRQQLEALRQGKDVQVAWSAPQLVSRADSKGLPEPVIRQAFKADAAKLPSYTGVEAPGGGYMLLRVSKVVEPEKVDRAQQKALGEGLAQVVGEEHFGAYISSLKQKAEISINKAQIERKP